MTETEILNTKIPKTNSQIQKASAHRIAVAIASAFLFENIDDMGRDFDNLFENGKGKEIKEEFTKIYNANPRLRYMCNFNHPNKNHFSPNMIS